MKIKTFFQILPLLAALSACQSQEPMQEIETAPQFRLTASLPSTDASRAMVTYGYYGDDTREVFQWDAKEDYITLFNITKFQEVHGHYSPTRLFLDPETIDGKKADFVFNPDNEDEEEANRHFQETLEPGDVILAFLGVAAIADISLVKDPSIGNVISYFAGSTFYPQKIQENPTTENALGHLSRMMRMYDIVKVGDDGKISDISFKYLTALIRVTLQNKTGKDLFNQKSEFVFYYPTGDIDDEDSFPFIYGFNYFSVTGNDQDGYNLIENFKAPEKRHPLNPTPPDETVVISNEFSHIVNETSPRVPLKDGETYEFYAIAPVRMGNNYPSGNNFYINIYDGVASGWGKYEDCVKYPITIENFKRAIEPGKRYWFFLTAFKDENGEPQLMLTSDYNEYIKTHPSGN